MPSAPGTSDAATADLDTPLGIALDRDGVVVADFHQGRVRRYTRDGDLVFEWNPAGDDRLLGPCGVAIAEDGTVLVTDVVLDRVLRFSPDGEVLARWGERGEGQGQFRGPFGIAVRAGEVFVTDLDNARIQVFTPDGAFLRAFGAPGREPGQLSQPWGIALDSEGALLVADHGNHRVQRLTPDGRPLGSFGALDAPDAYLLGPVAVAVGADDALYVTDLANPMVQKFGRDGRYVTQLRAEGARAPFGSLFAVAAEAGRVFVADAAGHRVVRLFDRSPAAMPRPASPVDFALRRAWPNPSASSIRIELAIPSSGRLEAALFDLEGRRVRELADAGVGPGAFVVNWDGRDGSGALARSGVYFVRARYTSGGGTRSLDTRVAVVR